MNSIHDLILQLKRDWTQERTAYHNGKECPFLLSCSFSPAGSVEPHLASLLPPHLIDFWRQAAAARLFVDANYGQWGQEIYDFQTAKAESRKWQSLRPKDFCETDLIIGRFLGDSDLLLIRADPSADDFGAIMVALPIDPRSDWYGVAPSLSAYLWCLEENQGSKYWEHSGS